MAPAMLELGERIEVRDALAKRRLGPGQAGEVPVAGLSPAERRWPLRADQVAIASAAAPAHGDDCFRQVMARI